MNATPERSRGGDTDPGRGGAHGAGVAGDLPPRPPRALEPFVAYTVPKAASFGSAAVELGLLRPDEVEHLATLQRRAGARGEPSESLGALAVRAGLITAAQLQQVNTARPAFIVHVDARHYGSPQFLTWVEDLRRRHFEPQVRKVSAAELAEFRKVQTAEAENDLGTLNAARRMFVNAARIGASDIHVLVRERHTEIQMRVLGDLRTVTSLSMRREEGEALIRATYAGLATVKVSYQPLEFQDGQIGGDSLPETGLSSVRLVRGPAYPVESGGSFMVARLQYGRSQSVGSNAAQDLKTGVPARPDGHFDPEQMGWTPRQLELAERLVRLPMGIALVTGPTGSGKTTTMNQLMRHQARLFPQLRQITIEDPPEYPMPWALQLEAKGAQFGRMVEKTLRMDPDILLVGELRSAEEAIAAMQAAMTGHFVWATLHVREAYKAIGRLEQLDPKRLGLSQVCDHETIIAMIAQRLVQVLCPECSLPLRDAPQEAVPSYIVEGLRTWGDTDRVRVHGEGCAHCRGVGTIGRRAVAEIVLTDERFMRIYREQGLIEARRYHRARPDADRSILANAIELVLAGTVDPMDAHRGVHQIEPYEEGQ